MGCVYSRGEFENANPRVFQVWNVDGNDRNVKPGKIEVTESQLVLYQKGDLTVRWPLRSLRRYGFDDELFSFECGRRCPTGPGVYAFRCARAEGLFNILQECLQNSGGSSFSGAGNISISAIEDQMSVSTSLSSERNVNNNRRQTPTPISPTVDAAGYLEPIVAPNHRRPMSGTSTTRSISPGSSSGFVRTQSGGVPSAQWSTANTGHTVTTSTTSCCNLGTCRRTTTDNSYHYVNEHFSEHVSSVPMCLMHQYVNTSVATVDIRPNHRCQHQSRNDYVNSSPLGLSPGHLPRGCCYCNCNSHCLHCVDANTNYAKLDDLLKQEQSAKRQKERSEHFYVNVNPEGSFQDSHSKISSMPKSGHFYANLTSPTSESTDETPKIQKSSSQVNYAILDLDKKEMVDKSRSISVPVNNTSFPNSPVRSPEGYAQIDFDKTVALSHSTIPCPQNDDSIRKTRHNAVIPCSVISA